MRSFISLTELSDWLPTKGNAVFTLLIFGIALWVQGIGAFASSDAMDTAPLASRIIAYQGHLTDSDGVPLTGTYPMVFRLYTASTQGTPLWEEAWIGTSSIQVSDGLFYVMLGSLTPIPQSLVTDHGELWLGIQVDSDNEMSPRVQLGGALYAVQANTVLNGSITTDKLASSAVVSSKILDGSVGTVDIANNAVTSLKISDGNVNTADIANGAVTGEKIANGTVESADLADGGVLSRDVDLNQGIRRAYFSGSSMQLSSSYQDIAGTTANISLDTAQTVVVYVVFDFKSQGNTLSGKLNVDGSLVSEGEALLAGASGTRGTVAQIYVLNLPAGTHTLKLQAKGPGLVFRQHTSLMYFSFSQ